MDSEHDLLWVIQQWHDVYTKYIRLTPRALLTIKHDLQKDGQRYDITLNCFCNNIARPK